MVPLINDPRVIAALGVIEHVRQEHQVAAITSRDETPCCLCGKLGAQMNQHHHGYGPFCGKHASGWGSNLVHLKRSTLREPTPAEVELAFATYLVRRLKDESSNRNA